ncbi:MAG: P-loop NTPase family protein [Henriciella sp.]
MAPSRQIPIKFPESELSFEDMEITAANRAICAAIRKPERWPYHAFCLVGAKGSGVTTLAKAWASERKARYIPSTALAKLDLPDIESLTETDLVVDDVDALVDVETLLLLLSGIKRHETHILLAAHSVPELWRVQTPDLRSRLKAAPLAELPAPDEDLMRARLRRAFARSFLDLPKSVEDYLVTRLGLDYSQIEETAEILAGATGDRPLTIPLTREILDEEKGRGDG